jgi:hypothetical protein
MIPVTFLNFTQNFAIHLRVRVEIAPQEATAEL